MYFGQGAPGSANRVVARSNTTFASLDASSLFSSCPSRSEALSLVSQRNDVQSFAQNHATAELAPGNSMVIKNGVCADVFSWIAVSSTDGTETLLTINVGSANRIVFESIGQYPLITATFSRWSGWEAQYCNGHFFGWCTGTGTFSEAKVDPFYVTGLGIPAPESPHCCAWAQWVGVGNSQGASNGNLVQSGVIELNGNYGNNVFAFYELLPANAVPITSCPVGGGDKMESLVSNEWANSYAVYLHDYSSNCTFFTDALNYSAMSAPTYAYYEGEAPVVNGAQSQVAIFGGTQIYGAMYGGGRWMNFDDNNNPTSQDTMNLGCGTNVYPSSHPYGLFTNWWQSSNTPGFGC
jgi:hypothetical protein